MSDHFEEFFRRAVDLAGQFERKDGPLDADWVRLEADIGYRFPLTHKRFVSHFGSGRFGNDLYLQNPRAAGRCGLNDRMLQLYAEENASFLQEAKQVVYPDSGLVLVANTTSRMSFFLDLGSNQHGENVLFADLGVFRIIDLGLTFAEFVCKLYEGELEGGPTAGLRESIWTRRDVPFFKPFTTS